MPRDSVGHTIKIALLLCLVCSALVSVSAVGLNSRQEANKQRAMRKNILVAAGIYDATQHGDADVEGLFEKRIEAILVNLDNGERVSEATVDPETYDQRAAARDPSLSVPIPQSLDVAGIRRREHYAFVYLVRGEDGQTLEKIVLPIRGYGLWSTLWGFLALDAQTLAEGPAQTEIRGITYYDQKETPGLGGEVENPSWQASWNGKHPYDAEWNVRVEVIKGQVQPGMQDADAYIDGLSGATITSQGVTNTMRYWLGEEGFLQFLKRKHEELTQGTGGSNGQIQSD